MKKATREVTDYQDFCPQGTSQERRRKMDVGDIFANQVKCLKCNNVVRSRNRHDYRYCACGSIGVDGGSWYGRRIGDIKAYEDMTIMYDDIHEE